MAKICPQIIHRDISQSYDAISGRPCLRLRLAEQQFPRVAIRPSGDKEQTGRPKQHSADRRDRAERQAGGGKIVAPRYPGRRKQQKVQEVEAGLSGPGHGRHVAKEDSDQVPVVAGYGDTGLGGDGDKKYCHENSESGHETGPSAGWIVMGTLCFRDGRSSITFDARSETILWSSVANKMAPGHAPRTGV